MTTNRKDDAAMWCGRCHRITEELNLAYDAGDMRRENHWLTRLIDHRASHQAIAGIVTQERRHLDTDDAA